MPSAQPGSGHSARPIGPARRVIYCAGLKLREVAARLECRLEGDGEIEISRVAGIETAQAGDLTFFANSRYATALRSTQAAAVILAPAAQPAPCPMLRTETPYLAFANAVALFADEVAPAPGIDPASSIAPRRPARRGRLDWGVRVGRVRSRGWTQNGGPPGCLYWSRRDESAPTVSSTPMWPCASGS